MVASLDWTIGRRPDFARGRCRLGSCFLAGSPATTAVHHHSHTVEDFWPRRTAERPSRAPYVCPSTIHRRTGESGLGLPKESREFWRAQGLVGLLAEIDARAAN